MLRFALLTTLATCFAAAQTDVPVPEWKSAAKEISGEAALIRVAARSVAGQQDGLAVDLALVREQIEGQQVRAAHIQTKLYELERTECAAGLYQDERLDQLKEMADRLSDLIAIQRVSLGVPERKPQWKILKRQAKSTDEIAEKIEKRVAQFIS